MSAMSFKAPEAEEVAEAGGAPSGKEPSGKKDKGKDKKDAVSGEGGKEKKEKKKAAAASGAGRPKNKPSPQNAPMSSEPVDRSSLRDPLTAVTV